MAKQSNLLDWKKVRCDFFHKWKYILIVPARPEDFMMEIGLLLNPTKTARCHPLNLPFNRRRKGQPPLAQPRGRVETHFSTIPSICPLHQNASRSKYHRYRIPCRHLAHDDLRWTPSRPKFQVNQYTVGGLGGHTGFCLRFLADRFELEHFHNCAHNQAHFQQP